LEKVHCASMRAFVLLCAVLVACPAWSGVEEVCVEGSSDQAVRLFLKARQAELHGEYREALDLYRQALELAPDSVEIRVTNADLLAELGLAESAVSLLRPGDDLDWYGKRTLALALSRLLGEQPQLMAEAEEALRASLLERPDDPPVQLTLARVLQARGQLAESEELVRELREARPTNPQLLVFHASLLEGEGRSAEAAELYRMCAGEASAVPMCRQRLVELLVDQGRSEEAAEALLSWSGENDLDQLVQAAALLSDAGQLERALVLVRSVLAQDPASHRGRRLEAILLSARGRNEEAAERLRSLLKDDRNNPDLLLSLARVEAQRSEYEDARHALTKAWDQVSHNPASEQAVECCLTGAQIELADGRIAAAKEWLERVPDPRLGGVQLVQLLAETWREREEWERGMAAMLRLQPRLEGTARDMALAVEAEFRLRMGQQQGLQRLGDLLRRDDLNAVLMAVRVLQSLERWEEVEKAVAVGLERFPEERPLVFARASALERLGRVSEAEPLFERLVEEDPADAAAANYLGYMWADAGVQLERALELIRVAVEGEPGNPAYLDSLGWVHFRLGNLDEAEQWLRQALANDGVGTDPTVLSHMGEVMAARGRTEEARRFLRRALDLGCEKPDHVEALLAELAPEPTAPAEP
jgi:tetratricopeptide (TPR) repeat protein